MHPRRRNVTRVAGPTSSGRSDAAILTRPASSLRSPNRSPAAAIVIDLSRPRDRPGRCTRRPSSTATRPALDGRRRHVHPILRPMSFQCPVCSCVGYSQVVVPKPKGGSYVTSFYACSDCTTMFLDPARYTKHRKPKVVPLAPDLTTGWGARRSAGRRSGAAGASGLDVAPRAEVRQKGRRRGS